MRMKCILLALGMLCFSVEMNAQKASDSEWNDLIWSIAQHESKQNPNARNGQYVGYLQISKILVKQCNILAGYQKYTFNDRYSKEKSIAMFIDYQEEYNPEGNLEKAIRLWNSGDLKCMTRKAKTERYYQRVMRRYNELAELR